MLRVYVCLAYIETNRLNNHLLCATNMPQYLGWTSIYAIQPSAGDAENICKTKQ